MEIIARYIGTGLLFGLVLSLAGCEYLPFGFTPIAQILQQPSDFEGRVVKLHGTVVDVNKIPFLEIQLYTLRDESGEMVIIQPKTLPRLGETLAIRGRVESLMILAGQGLGTTLHEIDRLPTLPEF
jgi:hypothetical protein